MRVVYLVCKCGESKEFRCENAHRLIVEIDCSGWKEGVDEYDLCPDCAKGETMDKAQDLRAGDVFELANGSAIARRPRTVRQTESTDNPNEIRVVTMPCETNSGESYTMDNEVEVIILEHDAHWNPLGS